MTDRIAEQGAMQYAIANPSASVSRLGGAGYLQGAIQDAITNGKFSATASRLGAQGRVYAKAAESNIVQNGTFDANVDGWSTNLATAEWSNGTMRVTNTGSNGSAYQNFTTIVGVTYQIDYELSGDLSRRVTKSDTTSQFGTNFVTFSSNINSGPVTFVATATTTYIHVGISSSTTGLTVVVDNVFVRRA